MFSESIQRFLTPFHHYSHRNIQNTFLTGHLPAHNKQYFCSFSQPLMINRISLTNDLPIYCTLYLTILQQNKILTNMMTQSIIQQVQMTKQITVKESLIKITVISLLLVLNHAICMNRECLECAEDEVTCIACPPGLYLDTNANDCRFCWGGIPRCYYCNLDKTECYKCLNPRTLVDGQCVGSNAPSDPHCSLFENNRCTGQCSLPYHLLRRTCVQQCPFFHYVDQNNQCQTCRSGKARCLECHLDPTDNAVICQKCLNGFKLSASGTCSSCPTQCINCDQGPCVKCNQGYSLLGTTCMQCYNAPICTACNHFSSQCLHCLPHYELQNGQCQTICGDLYLIDQPCDLGQGIDYDGCSDNCTVDPGYSCRNDTSNTRSTCSYSSSVQITVGEVELALDSHKCSLVIKMSLSPPLHVFSEINMEQIFSFKGNLKITSIKWSAKDQLLTVEADYSEEIDGQSVDFELVPSENVSQSFFSTKPTTGTFTIYNSLFSNLFYTQGQFEQIAVIDGLCWCIAIAAWLAWFAGWLSGKLAGIQAMICVQFCWMARLWNSSPLPLHYYSMVPLKYSTLYNYPFQLSKQSPQLRFASFCNFNTEFFHTNFNVSLTLILAAQIYFIFRRVCLHVQQLRQQKRQKKKQQQTQVKHHTQTVAQTQLQAQMKQQKFSESLPECTLIRQDADLEELLKSNLMRALEKYEQSVEIVFYASVTLILNFVNCAMVFFSFGDISSTVSIVCFVIGGLSFVPSVYFFCFDRFAIGIFRSSLKIGKPLRQFHYAFVILLFASAVGLLALQCCPWAPLIPLLTLALQTVILRPYSQCIDNIRFALCLCVTMYAVSINFILQYIELQLSNKITMLFILLVLLFIIIIGSLAFIAYQCYAHYKKQEQMKKEGTVKGSVLINGEIQGTGETEQKVGSLMRILRMTKQDLKYVMSLMLQHQEDVFKLYKAMRDKASVFSDMEMTAELCLREVLQEKLAQKPIEDISMLENNRKKMLNFKKMTPFSKQKKDFEALYGKCDSLYSPTYRQTKEKQEKIKRQQSELKRLAYKQEQKKLALQKFFLLPTEVQDHIIMLIVHNELYIKFEYVVRKTEDYKKPVNQASMKAYQQIDIKGTERASTKGTQKMETKNPKKPSKPVN